MKINYKWFITILIMLSIWTSAKADDLVDYYYNGEWLLIDNLAIDITGTIDSRGISTRAIDAKDSIYWIDNYGAILSTYYGIDSEKMLGDIYNYGIIDGNYAAINANAMTGNIYNYASASIQGAEVGIDAFEMVGNIYNERIIWGSEFYAINADSMEGNIYNYATGEILSDYVGINASNMSGSIYNDGNIIATYNYGIYAGSMSGDIINNQLVYGFQVGIYAFQMSGDIYNNDEINAGADGINAEEMSGDIYNYGDIETTSDYSNAINAINMSGNIINNGILYGDEYEGVGIWAEGMTGDITNFGNGIIYGGFNGILIYDSITNIHNAGLIHSDDDAAILIDNVTGYIDNYGNIESYFGIDAYRFKGDIINNIDGIIYGEADGIFAEEMTGDIINYGTIEGYDSHGVDIIDFDGIIYNYGTIIGFDAAILSSYSDLTIIGNGTIVGDIENSMINSITNTLEFYDDSNDLNLHNDIADTVLDLSHSTLSYWDTINLLQGEMIITDIFNSGSTNINQSGDDTYIHFGVDYGYMRYVLEAGTFNPYSSSSHFQSLTFAEFTANAGSVIEIDFGDENQSDQIDVDEFGALETGTTVRFIPQNLFEAGFSDIYWVFKYFYYNGDINYEIPFMYTVEEYKAEYEIARTNKSYADYASNYNKGFAKLVDSFNNVDNEDQNALRLSLEQSWTVDEFNEILNRFNKVGLASLANNNFNYISSRINNLFKRLKTFQDFDVNARQIADIYSDSGNVCSPNIEPFLNKTKRDRQGNSIWFDVYYNDHSLDGKDDYTQSSNGYEVAIGFDKLVAPDVILGLSGNYNDYDADIKGDTALSIDSEGYGLNLYSHLQSDSIMQKIIIGYNQYDNTANSNNFDSSEYFAAYRIDKITKVDDMQINPFMGLRYAVVEFEDINDGPDSGLYGDSYSSLEGEFGVNLIGRCKKTGIRYRTGISLLHEFLDTDYKAKAYSQYGDYNQGNIERDANKVRLTIGINHNLTNNISIDLEYAKEFSSNTDNNSLNAKLSYSF